jgi:hypothetical protein
VTFVERTGHLKEAKGTTPLRKTTSTMLSSEIYHEP